MVQNHDKTLFQTQIGDKNLRFRRTGTITSSQVGSRGRADWAVAVKAMGPVLKQKGESQYCLQEGRSKEGNEGQSRRRALVVVAGKEASAAAAGTNRD